MSDATELGLLQTALDQAGEAVAGARPDQAAWPTPCRSWDLSTLIGHVLHDLRAFADVARGGRYRPGIADVQPQEWTRSFSDGSADLLAAWREHQSLEARDEQSLLQQIAEFEVHAWDIARATRQRLELDGEAAERALAWARQNLRPEFRGAEDEGKGFGPELQVDEHAPAGDRLAAFFGRDPAAWRG